MIAVRTKAGNPWLKYLRGTLYDPTWPTGGQTREPPDLGAFRAWVEGGGFGFADDSVYHQHYDYSDELAAAMRAVPARITTVVRDPYDVLVFSYFTFQRFAAIQRRGDPPRQARPAQGQAPRPPQRPTLPEGRI